MSVITKIEEQKNKKRVNIYVDNAFFCGLLKETAIVFGLKENILINESDLEIAIFESEVKSAFNKSMDYLSVRLQTKKQLFDKLLKKGYEKKVVQETINRLEEYKYIDDNTFARSFIEQNAKYSKKMLENKLLLKGVSKDIIKKYLTEELDEKNIELCKKQIEKYIKNKDMTKLNSKQKLFASLARKGFQFDDIKIAYKAICGSSDDLDSYDLNIN